MTPLALARLYATIADEMDVGTDDTEHRRVVTAYRWKSLHYLALHCAGITHPEN